MVVLEKGSGSDGDSPILTNIFIGSNIIWVGAVVADMFECGTSSPPYSSNRNVLHSTK
jgi:hypothetical protein